MTNLQVVLLACTILGLLLSVVGWFFAKVWSDQAARNNILDESLKELSGKLHDLSLHLATMNGLQIASKDGYDEMKAMCVNRHEKLERRIDDYGNKLSDHDTRIRVIEEKVK